MSLYKISFISKQTNKLLDIFTFEFNAISTHDYMIILTEYIEHYNLRDCILISEIIG